jgi:hypothetical protein
VLIEWTVVVIFAVLPREFPAAFIEEAREQSIAAEAAAGATRRALSEVHGLFWLVNVSS